jgi:GNAT superfamily N-acetyltransferase
MIRGPRSSDQAFIASTWVRSMSGVGGRKLGRDGGLVAKRIDDVFDRGDTRALVRHAAGDQDRIMGWVVYVDGPGVPVAHYLYVRKEHRGKGIGAELLTAVGIRREATFVYTCLGPSTRQIVTAYPLGVHMPLKEFLCPS